MDSEGNPETRATDGRVSDRTLERLHRTTNELYASTSIRNCTQLTVDAAIDVLGFDWCIVASADEDSGYFEIVSTAGGTTLEVGDKPLETGEGIVGKVFEQGEPEIVHDVTSTEEDDPLDDRIESAVTIPIGEWGVFQALGTEPEAFDDSDLQLLELLVTPMTTTIERIQTEQRLREQKRTLERQNRRIEALHSVSTEMKKATDRKEIFDLFIAAVEDVLEIVICTLDERDGDVLKTRAVGSEMDLEDFYTEIRLDTPNSVATDTYERGETIRIDDLNETEYRAANSAYRSLISVPLGEWGIFQAATTEVGAFDETDKQLIELLADSTEAAVERIERERELQQRAEKLRQQNEQLDRFASRLSHELRNPLSVLETRVLLARETGEVDHFDHVERSIRRMDRLIDDTLALARGHEVEVEKEVIDLAEVTRTSWNGLRTPEMELTVDVTREIHADEDRLYQLLANLFRNAVEHAGTDVTVTVGDLPDGFYVADDGPGIQPEQRNEVLAPGSSGLHHGTGLGLAVVQKMARAHDWSLAVTESEDGGAQFEFRGVQFA